MKKSTFIFKTCIMWVFLCLIALPSMGAKTKESMNSFAAPDFAFPKTVAANARPELKRALRNGDGPLALQALIQTVIAENLISESNATTGAHLMDSVASLLQPPYSSLAYLLEARLYRSIYSDSPYIYNNRVMPLTPVPEDIGEWSRDIFANKIIGLTEKAFRDVTAARKKGFEKLTSVVENATQADTLGLKIYDFMTMQAIYNLQPFGNSSENIIPFSTGQTVVRESPLTSSGLSEAILSDNERWHDEMGPSQASSVMDAYRVDMQSGNALGEELRRLADKYRQTPYAARFYIRLIGTTAPSDSQKYSSIYGEATEYLRRFPDCRDSGALSNAIKNMCRISFSTEVPSQSMPGREINGKITVRNMQEFHVIAIRVKERVLKTNRCSLEDVLEGELAASVKIENKDYREPFYKKSPFSIPGLESGVYAIACSSTSDLGGLITNADGETTYPFILVSRLSTIKSRDNKKKEEGRQLLYVVDGSTQKPLPDAKVKFIPAWKNSKWKTLNSTTDKDGMVVAPEGTYDVAIRSGNDILMDRVYDQGYAGDERRIKQGQLFTDLSIYHPGDSVRFTGVLYSADGTHLEAAPDQEIKVILHDANYQQKSTLRLKTDRFGRITGSFLLPADGLLGSWAIQLADERNFISQRNFEVADYKAPSFYVTTEGTEGEVKLGETVRIKGEVRTYSGMPVADADIKFNVSYMPWRWSRIPAADRAEYGAAVKSGADGRFIIELPTEGLKGTPYASGCYRLSIAATNTAGETQESAPIVFSLGQAYRIAADIGRYIKISSDSSPQAKVGVYDMLDHPVMKKIYYKMVSLPDSVAVDSGEFDSGRFTFDFSKLKSGKYSVTFSLNEEVKEENQGNETYSTSFIVWRPDDKNPPVETPLWLPEDRIIVDASNSKDGKVKIKTGSSYPDSYLYAEMSDMNGIFERRWVRVSDGIIEIPVASPKADSRVKVSLSGMHDLIGVQAGVILIPAIQTKGLEITADTFRDRIIPGGQEKWTFRFSFDNRDLADIPVMAVMSNKALDALASFQWLFNPYGNIYWNLPAGVSGRSPVYTNWNCNPVKSLSTDVEALRWPVWNTYGYPLYSRGSSYDSFAGGVMVRGAHMMKAKAYQEAVVKEEAADGIVEMKSMATAVANDNGMTEESAMEEPQVAPGDMPQANEELVRDIECPLAFFMPEIATDGQGKATLDFEVPQFNGTWKLQVMGYIPDGMRGAVLTRDAIADKPVMVQLNAPRFARTGDLLYVNATVFNNTPDEADLKGKIEFFNPLTGDVYAFLESSPEAVAPMGSRVLTESMRIPADMEILGIRVYGSGTMSRDGEQTIIPIYPSSTPVTESETFYLAPGENNLTITIPQNHRNGTVTLNYTDNPIWECVTALPSISTPDSQNALAQAAALYANSVTSGLLNKYPVLAEALRLFADPANSADSTLVSNLQKNAALKIVALNNTPWVQDAQSQTLRMSRLAEYADLEKTEKAIKDNLSVLSNLQQADGGWSWCENMKSSRWISMEVLGNLSRLKRNGWLPAKAEKMAIKGFAFVDNDITEEWKRIGSDKYSYISLLNYLYVRSNYGKLTESSDFAKIKARAIQEIAKNWKKMDIYGKATAAMVLYREGKAPLAHTILGSLEEYSSSSKEKGVWFDNLKSSYDGQGKLLTTAQTLEAWSEISPDSPVIDGLRQWILLSKQTQDWGNGISAASLVQAILESGSNWTRPNDPPEFYVGDERVYPDRISSLNGSVTIPLSADAGTLSIRRSASGPAWGGIVSQYVAPIVEVEAESVPELSVEKSIYVIDNDSTGTKASEEKMLQGDRVRVTLTIKCDRDLEYVAITDGRSAALQPADQISGYVCSDGVWMYREMRNASTNLFIPFLSKGTHMVTYDCFIDREGEYSLGIAEAQSQYAPVITAHSGGRLMVIGK